MAVDRAGPQRAPVHRDGPEALLPHPAGDWDHTWQRHPYPTARVCDTSTRSGVRHPDSAGMTRAQRRWWLRGHESGGPAGGDARSGACFWRAVCRMMSHPMNPLRKLCIRGHVPPCLEKTWLGEHGHPQYAAATVSHRETVAGSFLSRACPCELFRYYVSR
jgi:hypothetical protein